MFRESAGILRSAAARKWRAALLIVGVFLLIAAHPPSTSAQPLVTGITNIGEESLVAFKQARTTGARFIRIPLYWQGTAPQKLPREWQPSNPDDPHYFWGPSDRDVARAVEAGLTPVLQVENAPLWAQRCQAPAGFTPPAICDPDPATLADFAKAAATRYSGNVPGLPRVRYWQGLNEPNLSVFFFPQYDTTGKPLSPGLYRNLINAFYSAVKTVDPSNLVLAAGLAPLAVPPWSIGPMRFARELLCMTGHRRPRPTGGDCGGGVHFDIFAIHPYTTGSPTHEGGINDVQLGDLPKLQRLLRAADRAGRIKGQFRHTPLWITEFSWDSSPPDPRGLPMKILTRWMAEALHQAWRAGVSHFFWFSLRDSTSLESGLYFRGATLEQDQPKEVLFAFRFPFVAYPTKRGLSFWGRTPDSVGGTVGIQVWRKGRWRRAFGARASKQGIFSGTVKSRYGLNKRGTVRAVHAGHTSVPFSMRPVRDFYHPPFG